MRCYCCDRNLSDMESVLKHPTTGEFLDTCRKCLKEIGIVPQEGSVKEDTYYDSEELASFDEIVEWDEDEGSE